MINKELAIYMYLDESINFVKEMLAKKDIIAINTDWDMFLDKMYKEKLITEKNYNNWLPPKWENYVTLKKVEQVELHLKATGEDDWGRKSYQGIKRIDKDGAIRSRKKYTYAEVDGLIHICTSYGEPECPIRKDIKIIIK